MIYKAVTCRGSVHTMLLHAGAGPPGAAALLLRTDGLWHLGRRQDVHHRGAIKCAACYSGVRLHACSPRAPAATVSQGHRAVYRPMQGTKAAPGMVPQALAMLFAVRPANMVEQPAQA